MILLASGLSLARENSFGRQLRLLAREMRVRGRRCLIAGTDPSLGRARRVAEGEVDLPRIDAAAVRSLTSGESVEAAILLGYPDRFPILFEAGPDLFLWAQFSRPPRVEALGRALPVPLTERTRFFLEQAGCREIGPTIPHGVDTTLFLPADPRDREGVRSERGIDRDALVVGTVGANTGRKRFDRLLEAFACLPLAAPALLVVKTDRERAPGGFDLVELAERHGVAARVRVICGELPGPELARLYAATDLYAHAAEWEGFCVPVVEAMACGVPVVAAATQGPGETVPYRAGLVDEGEWVEEGGSRLFRVAPGALAATLGRLAADAPLRAQLGRAGRDEVVRRYETGAVADRWMARLDAGRG